MKLIKYTNEEFRQIEGEMWYILYNLVVWLLIYAIVVKRIDLVFVVSVMIQNKFKTKNLHWKRIKKFIKYLQDTTDLKLCIISKKIDLWDYCNVVWARKKW